MTSMLNTAAASDTGPPNTSPPNTSASSSAPPTEAALRRRLGDILVERGTLTRAALDGAIKRQQRQQSDPSTRRLRLGALLVDLGLVDEHEVAQALGELLDKQVVDPRTVEIDLAFAQLIPRASAERDHLLILGTGPSGIRIVAADPTDVVALDDVRRATGVAKLEISIATPSVVQELIQRVWAISDQSTPTMGTRLISNHQPDLSRSCHRLTVMAAAGHTISRFATTSALRSWTPAIASSTVTIIEKSSIPSTPYSQ